MTSACEQLDDYLARFLDEPDRKTFVGHMAECPACAVAVREASEIDALVNEINCGEAIPFGLTQRVERRLRHARRGRMTAVACAVAASVVGAWVAIHWPTPPDAKPQAPLIAIAKADVRVEFGDDIIAVPVATGSPNVTFYWVYPNMAAGPDPVLPAEGG
jgi:hypothetical protein